MRNGFDFHWDYMKICAISDLHGYKIPIPKCDVLIIAGDISNMGNVSWFNNNFLQYLEDNKNKYDICFLVFGNHDDKIQMANITDGPEYIKILTNTGYEYKGKKFFGSPYCKYASNIIDTMNTFREPFLKKLFMDIPEDTDILITHNPPYGFGDTVMNQPYHLGSESLMDRINVVKPQIHIFGHIHTGKKYTKNNGTDYFNVSILDEDYHIAYKPTIINI